MAKAERISFEDEITRNKIKSIILMSSVFVILILLGFVISMAVDPSISFVIFAFSIVFSIGYTVFGFYNSDKVALASVRAQPADKVEHKVLFDVVEDMSLASGLPMPRVYVMNSEQINAFASGRDPKHAVICVTTGALKKLNKDELEGVVAHEMGHIANFDIRFMTLTAVMIGIISILAQIFLRSFMFSSGGNRDREGGGIQVVFILIGMVLAILAPIVAQLVSLAISRKREYTADATGVKFTRYPPGLRNALIKIKNESIPVSDTKKYPSAVAPLFISNPFKRLNVSGLFSTHPPIDKRIEKLERM